MKLPKNAVGNAQKVPRMGVEVGKVKAESASTVTFLTALKPRALYRTKMAIIEQLMAQNVAPPDAATTGYTAVTLNQIASDPDSIIKNASDFTGVGGSNSSFELAAGSYYIRTEFYFGRSTTDGSAFARQTLNAVVPYKFRDSNTALDQFPMYSVNARSIRATNTQTALLAIEGFFEVDLIDSTPAATQAFQLQTKYSTTSAVSGVAMNFASESELYGRVTIIKFETPTVEELSDE